MLDRCVNIFKKRRQRGGHEERYRRNEVRTQGLSERSRRKSKEIRREYSRSWNTPPVRGYGLHCDMEALFYFPKLKWTKCLKSARIKIVICEILN